MTKEEVIDWYHELIGKINTRKEEIKKFDIFLKEQTTWFSSPASTRYHLAYEGGLLEHSVNVANTLLKIKATLAPEIMDEACIISGLYHDIGKIGMPNNPYYLPNPEKWQVEKRGINYVVNKELIHLDIATRSIHLLCSHVTLSEDEVQAIRYHDGQYIRENQSVAHKETKLTRLLQFADNWAGGVIENRK